MEAVMKILLAIDGSRHSQDAVDEVAQQPWPKPSVVQVLTVVERIVPGAPELAVAGNWDRLWEEQLKEAEHLTVRVADALKATDAKVETAIRQGEPRAEIIDEATDWAADVIVVGSHGHTGLKRFLLGSVAQSIVSHAPCSVYVVRHRHAAA
ncbi:MAG: universal stress protein [Luteitalea sp.]|nr:universal stress protein [Luteitalea sp.]